MKNMKENINIEEKVVAALLRADMLLTTAESCTGGMVAASVVNVSGASKVFHQGYITYCDEAKNSILGVRKETLDKYKAVSAQTACEMALGALKAAQADIAVSVTGVAGPSMEDGKPVGLVYIGIASDRIAQYKALDTYNWAVSIDGLTCASDDKTALYKDNGKYVVVRKCMFNGSRADIRSAACKEALELIYEYSSNVSK